MKKLPLTAFENLTLIEIKHIVDVMREADIQEHEEVFDSCSTIKRVSQTKSNSTEQKEPAFNNSTDPNNNTLKDDPLYVNNSTLKTRQERPSSSGHGIPSVPRVHMGAGFMKIFNQCPLEIHASSYWTNSETKGKDKYYF